jgi:hypothetical protein
MRRQASREAERDAEELATKERREHKDTEKKRIVLQFLAWVCLVETFLTGRHEIMKTGRRRSLLPPQVQFHVFMLFKFSC